MMNKEKGLENVIGYWQIEWMEMWGKDYMDMEVQAYISIGKDGGGEFQFGLVEGNLHGEYYPCLDRKGRFEFTWEGGDDLDSAFGFGWVEYKSKGRIDGELRFHGSDGSKFLAINDGYRKGMKVFTELDIESRLTKIIGGKTLSVDTRTLRSYLRYLKKNINLPHRVTGVESSFVYSDCKMNTPSGNEIFDIVAFEENVKDYSNIFVKVRRLSVEGGIFLLQLCEFESIDKDSIESKILEDYSYWIENYL